MLGSGSTWERVTQGVFRAGACVSRKKLGGAGMGCRVQRGLYHRGGEESPGKVSFPSSFPPQNKLHEDMVQA